MKIHEMTIGPISNNCYILEDEATKQALVIDAPAPASSIIEKADSLALKITDIILTHGHFDHILALPELKEKTGARISVFEKTTDFLKDSSLNLCTNFGTRIPYVAPDVILSDGDTIDFCGNKITVLHTPGHTDDSICLLCENLLFSGDTLFSRGIGRYDFKTGNLKLLLNSIYEKLYILPSSTIVYPGHGPSTTIGEEKRENPYTV